MQQADRFRITELENLLTDERFRGNQHKLNYERVKEDYKNVESELTIIHQRLKEEIERSNSDKSSRESYVKKLEETLKEKQDHIYGLERQVASTNPDVLRKEINDQESKRFDERLSKVQAEADEFHEKYNKSHYEICILNSQLEYADKGNATTLMLLKSQHLAEVKELKAKIAAFEDKKEEPVKDYSVELRTAENELLQADSRLKVMHAECDELRAQIENLCIQIENDSQSHSKQLYEKIASIRSLESEKEILQMQKEVLRSEVTNLQQEKSVVYDEYQSHRREHLLIKKQLEDCKRNYEIDTTNLSIKLRTELMEHESEKEKLKDNITELKSEMNHLRTELESIEQAFAVKEENFNRYLLLLKQQNYQRCSDLERANKELEMKIKEAEFAQCGELTKSRKKMEQMAKELHSVTMDKASLERENLDLKNKVEEKAVIDGNRFHEDLLKQNSDFHREIQLLKDKISKLSSSGGENGAHNETMLKRMAIPQHQEETNQLRLTLEQQKYQYQQRIDCLENQMKDQQNTWLSEKQSLQHKVKQYGKLITKLRDRFGTQKSHLEEVEVQNELLKHNVPIDDHLHLKNVLLDLQRKHERFHQVMSSSLIPDTELAMLNAEMGATSTMKSPFTLQTHQEIGKIPFFENFQDSTRLKKPAQKRIQNRRQRFTRNKQSESRRVADYSSSSDLESL